MQQNSRRLLSSQASSNVKGVLHRLTAVTSHSRAALVAKPLARAITNASTYSEYEYPLATEAPVISRTTAAEAKVTDTRKGPESNPQEAPIESPEEIAKRNRELNTKLSTTWGEITTTTPMHIPRNVSADQLAAPETLTTTLDNGVRVVSQETYGQVSTVGVVCNVGSRTELPHERGVVNLLEVLAFGTTPKHTGPEITMLLQEWGGQRFASTGREQSLHCVDLLRPNVPKAMEMLLDQVLLQPQFTPQELEESKQAMAYQSIDMMPEFILGEALQTAAYGDDQQLGQAHFYEGSVVQDDGSIAEVGPVITPEIVRDYWERQFVQQPSGLVVGGAGVTHDLLVELVEKHWGHLKEAENPASTQVKESTYRGGQVRIQRKPSPLSSLPDTGFVHTAVAFEVGGWHSDDLVAACVLQTLLGGGSSFSAGGPGKGMYSRLYREVLNKFPWAESAQAFTSFHLESGLFGISGSTHPKNTRNMVQVLTHHLTRLAVDLVADEELDRARNMLKCNVLTQLESRLVLFEDMGRQVLTYGHREDMSETCEKIENVSAEDVRNIAKHALEKPLTLATVGPNLANAPDLDEVNGWLK